MYLAENKKQLLAAMDQQSSIKAELESIDNETLELMMEIEGIEASFD